MAGRQQAPSTFQCTFRHSRCYDGIVILQNAVQSECIIIGRFQRLIGAIEHSHGSGCSVEITLNRGTTGFARRLGTPREKTSTSSPGILSQVIVSVLRVDNTTPRQRSVADIEYPYWYLHFSGDLPYGVKCLCPH